MTCAAGAFGLGLLRDGADHALVEVDVLDLDVGHLDPPVIGTLVENRLNIGVELVALGKHVVELVLAEYRSQRRLRELAGRLENVGDPDDGLLGIDDAEVDHGVDLHRNVVARDHVLGRHVEDDDAQVDLDHLLDSREQDDEARALDALETTEEEDHAALVLLQDLENVVGQYDQERDDDSDVC